MRCMSGEYSILHGQEPGPEWEADNTDSTDSTDKTDTGTNSGKGTDNTMKMFRFAVMGAGNISNRFCDAVSRLEGCEVAAVASKSMERARAFAEKNRLSAAYDSYEEMLKAEKPDCVYIGVVTGAHYELTSLCLDYRVPVLCEKAMFRNSGEAREIFARAAQQRTFVMEAMWSRFLPAVKKVRQWVEEGRIGQVRYCDTAIGFQAPADRNNRFFSAALGGGAAYDITVYACELTTFMLGQEVSESQEAVLWADTGVDLTEHVTFRYPHTLATMTTTFAAPLEERMMLVGDSGKIVLPRPHHPTEAFRYDGEGKLAEHFQDEVTENGFVYQAAEVVECVRAGKLESSVVPWDCTLFCAELFDRILAAK